MAKSLRPIMRRWRKLKRGHLENLIVKPKEAKIYENNLANLAGLEYRQNDILHSDTPRCRISQGYPPLPSSISGPLPFSAQEGSGRAINWRKKQWLIHTKITTRPKSKRNGKRTAMMRERRKEMEKSNRRKRELAIRWKRLARVNCERLLCFDWYHFLAYWHIYL